MNRYHPYCPPLPQIPADIILVDTCDMRRFVNPLTGILHPLGNVLGYRYVSPDGDGFPVTYSVTHSHTDHSSLITDHCSLLLHLLRKRKGFRNGLFLLWVKVLQQRFEHLAERGSDEWEISVFESVCVLRG